MTEYEAYVRQWAQLHQANPDILVKAGNAEGGFNDPTRQSNAMKNGIREPSYGPYQLLIGGKGTGFPEGLGNRALAAGIDPRNPAQWKEATNFALTEAQNKGWGQWYGPKSIGITGHMGFDGSVPAQMPATQGVSAGQVADAMGPVVAQQQAAQAAAQNAAVAQQQAATTAAATPDADPFGGLMSLLAMSQQQQPQATEVEADTRPKQQIDPEKQVAMTSQTPNVYLERLRKMRKA